MRKKMSAGLTTSFWRRDLTGPRFFTMAGLLALALLASACLRGGLAFGQAPAPLLEDDFTKDSSLNSSLWTDNSSFLDSLAAASSSPPASFVVPTLAFSQAGMKMTGLTQDFQTTGVQSVSTFTPPFTVLAWASASHGTADPFEIFLASSDLSQFVTVTANVSPTYDGMWANAQNISQLWQLGEQFQPTISPTLGNVYRILITVDAQGVGSVTMENGSGKVSGSFFSLQPGTGPFYVVLGQRIGLAKAESQIAYWKYVSVVD
jgi:hypothetical protein